MKTHLHYANELYKWTEELSQEESPEFKEVKEGFKNSQIEMENSLILRLGNYKGSQNLLDVGQTCDLLFDSYKSQQTYIKKYYEHKSPLQVDRDIFIATAGNLIKNACEYSDGLIWIKTQESKHDFSLQISNTGRTLSPSDIKKILNEGGSLQGQSGLGLSIAKYGLKNWWST